MSAQDMRDVLGLSGEARPPPLKKQKTVEKRPLEKGFAREVAALMGERAPDRHHAGSAKVQTATEEADQSQALVVPFTNAARDDGLVLRHWKPKETKEPVQQPAPETNVDGEATQTEEKRPTQEEEEEEEVYQYAKYNIEVEVPTYTEELYNAQLQDPDWTKEETDYLISLVKDYGRKWAVVTDRYDFAPTSLSGGQTQPRSRSMEDLKARFYTVSAKCLAQDVPISSMTGPQYTLYSILTSFNPVQETSRKQLAEGHLKRTPDEVAEEATLLSELQRIMINQASLEAERREIRERLDYPTATPNATGTAYNTSAALQQLFTQLLAQDRLKKDRRLRAGELQGQTPPAPNNPADAKTPFPAPLQRTRRVHLTPAAAHRFFVTTHDRLNSGVSFASDKLHKPRIAKSTIQTDRIAAVLQFLKIPEHIPLPTQRVVEEFDKLMQGVGTLLEMRKVAEKEEGRLGTSVAQLHRPPYAKAAAMFPVERRSGGRILHMFNLPTRALRPFHPHTPTPALEMVLEHTAPLPNLEKSSMFRYS
ncbi:swr complex subunit [Taxawa tesnikishii (nom. ined.)]|nr:swr complex subunit [Dothideales sp. JES 119]